VRYYELRSLKLCWKITVLLYFFVKYSTLIHDNGTLVILKSWKALFRKKRIMEKVVSTFYNCPVDSNYLLCNSFASVGRISNEYRLPRRDWATGLSSQAVW
jgi:hypothetical protein